MKTKIITIVFLFSVFLMKAEVRLPYIFCDSMVLQQNKSINIWGWAKAKTKVTVCFHNQKKVIISDKSGIWKIALEPEKAGGPFQLTVKEKNTILLKDVYVGEVWICSGQSNMEMPIAGWGRIFDFQNEIQATNYPLIRQFDVPNGVSIKPLNNTLKSAWHPCIPKYAGDFSATAYFFGRNLWEKLHVPIGLINTTWGGTISESWTSAEAFQNASDKEMREIGEEIQKNDFERTSQERYKVIVGNLEKQVGKIDENQNTTNWMKNIYDDSTWKKLKVPENIEKQGLQDFDGILWYRRTFEITSADAGKEATVELAKIDDVDETYINGIKVGAMTSYDADRKYNIPSGILKQGTNLIAVKVTDNSGLGGIYGDSKNVKITIGNTLVNLSGEWKYKIQSVFKPSEILSPNDFPSLLYNAMINPLIPYNFRGVIWYQGEANVDRAYQYRKAFPLMINDWRKKWNCGDFPFLFVQLSSFGSAEANSNNGSKWAELRESQTETLTLPSTGMVVTTDIGNAVDIHPKNKKDVGKRLASIALHDVYKIEGEYASPMFKNMQIDKKHIILSFTHCTNGWYIKDKYNYIKGFEIAGNDKKFVPAKAYIRNNQIIVFQDDIADPVAVRYNWADDAGEGNVYNKEMFPLAPFRSDDWKGITDTFKYAIY